MFNWLTKWFKFPIHEPLEPPIFYRPNQEIPRNYRKPVSSGNPTLPRHIQPMRTVEPIHSDDSLLNTLTIVALLEFLSPPHSL